MKLTMRLKKTSLNPLILRASQLEGAPPLLCTRQVAGTYTPLTSGVSSQSACMSWCVINHARTPQTCSCSSASMGVFPSLEATPLGQELLIRCVWRGAGGWRVVVGCTWQGGEGLVPVGFGSLEGFLQSTLSQILDLLLELPLPHPPLCLGSGCLFLRIEYWDPRRMFFLLFGIPFVFGQLQQCPFWLCCLCTFVRTRSTTTRDRNLQFRGAVSTGGSPLDFLLFLQFLCAI